MWLVGLLCVTVVFLILLAYFLLTFFILIHILIKIQQKSGKGVIRGVGVLCNSQNKEYKSCGILTRTVWSVVVGHVVLALHIVHSLETNRAGQIQANLSVI